jgi:methionine-S-sulfoxide reductase
MQTVVLGGGCFWCIEAIFQGIEGVINVTPGYAGGETEDPNYQDVCAGNTGHAEVVKIDFDENVITLKEILKIFFLSHDPTTLNKQGADVGTQYRSIILYNNKEQKEVIDKVLEEIKGDYSDEVVTEVKPLEKFYKAEDYHINYYENNPNARYCKVVIKPKLEKTMKNFE